VDEPAGCSILAEENELLREQTHRLESVVRKIEMRLEETENTLRHTQVELSGMKGRV